MGLVFGSFGNVVIWRLPRGESLSTPPSHCPQCETPIRWYDNIPLVSWFALLGRCRACGAPIPMRYPLVELLSGLLWLAAVVRFGATASAIACIVFFYLLLLLAFIDLDTMRLPNQLVGLLAAVAVLALVITHVTGRVVVPLMPMGAGWLGVPVLYSALGAALSAGSVSLLAAVYSRVRGTAGFGMGDIKLLAVIGIFLGPYSLLVMLMGSVLGAVYGVAASRRSSEGMQHMFPFGPFLALAAVIVTLWGAGIVGWYAGIVAP